MKYYKFFGLFLGALFLMFIFRRGIFLRNLSYLFFFSLGSWVTLYLLTKRDRIPDETAVFEIEKHAYLMGETMDKSDVLKEIDTAGRHPDADYRISRIAAEAIDGAEKFADRVIDFHKILDQKFAATELTYQRYHTAVNEAEVIVDRNLRILPVLLRTASSTEKSQDRRKAESVVADNRNLMLAIAGLTADLSLVGTDGVTKEKFQDTLAMIDTLRRRVKLYEQ